MKGSEGLKPALAGETRGYNVAIIQDFELIYPPHVEQACEELVAQVDGKRTFNKGEFLQ